MSEITYNAGDVVGKSLIATEKIPVYSDWRPGTEKIIGYVETGNTCGVVYSYVGGTGTIPLYWMFLTPDKTAYFIKHDPAAFNTSNVIQQMQVDWVKSIEQQATDAQEKQAIADKGAFIYYLEKYGTVVLLGVAGLVLFTEYFKYNGKNK